MDGKCAYCGQRFERGDGWKSGPVVCPSCGADLPWRDEWSDEGWIGAQAKGRVLGPFRWFRRFRVDRRGVAYLILALLLTPAILMIAALRKAHLAARPPDSRELLLTLQGDPTGVYGIAFQPRRSGRLLGAMGGGHVILWDASTGGVDHTFGVPSPALQPVRSVAFSPDGGRFASGMDDGTIRVWDVESGDVVRAFKAHDGYVGCVAYSPDGDCLASAGSDGLVRIWGAEGDLSRQTLTGQSRVGGAVAFSLRGDRLAGAGRGGAVHMWDVATGQIQHTLTGHTRDVMSLAFRPDGKQLASGAGDGTVRIWDAEAGRCVMSLPQGVAYVNGVAYSPDGMRLGVALNRPGRGQARGGVKLWDLATGRDLRTFEGHRLEVFSVAFSSDGSRLASGSADGTVKLWNLTLLVFPAGRPAGVR